MVHTRCARCNLWNFRVFTLLTVLTPLPILTQLTNFHFFEIASIVACQECEYSKIAKIAPSASSVYHFFYSSPNVDFKVFDKNLKNPAVLNCRQSQRNIAMLYLSLVILLCLLPKAKSGLCDVSSSAIILINRCRQACLLVIWWHCLNWQTIIS